MKGMFNWVSHLAALVGTLDCLIAGIASVIGQQTISGYDVKTVFLVGIAGMVLACLLRLYHMSME